MGQPQTPFQGAIMRDQRRAIHAYQAIAKVPNGKFDDYKATVQGFGGDILRSGLMAAIAGVQRLKEDHGGKLVLGHVAGAGIPALAGCDGNALAARVRGLGHDDYIFTTREALLVVTWLKRAAQAHETAP